MELALVNDNRQVSIDLSVMHANTSVAEFTICSNQMHAMYHMFFPYSVTVQLFEQGPISHCEECNRCCKRS